MEDSRTQGRRFQAPAWSQPSSTDSSGGDNDHSVASLKFLLTIFTPTLFVFLAPKVLLDNLSPIITIQPNPIPSDI